MCVGSHRIQRSAVCPQEGHREQSVGYWFTAEQDMTKVIKIMNQVNAELFPMKFCTTSGRRNPLELVEDVCKTGKGSSCFSYQAANFWDVLPRRLWISWCHQAQTRAKHV